ncbi:hypothetical protein D3C71_2120280 [compost metagenome]
MAAGVHHPRPGGAVRRIAEFGHGQRIHIGPQADGRAGAVFQRADHACSGQTPVNLQAHRR